MIGTNLSMAIYMTSFVIIFIYSAAWFENCNTMSFSHKCWKYSLKLLYPTKDLILLVQMEKFIMLKNA